MMERNDNGKCKGTKKESTLQNGIFINWCNKMTVKFLNKIHAAISKLKS